MVDGYITSRVVFVDDSEHDGTLTLELMPGRIEDIRHYQDSVGNTQLSSLFPVNVVIWLIYVTLSKG